MSVTKQGYDSGSIKILIVDDHPVVREGLRIRLGRELGFCVCGEAGDIPEAVALVAETIPHLAIIDVVLRNGNGLDLVRRLRDRAPDVKTLVWSMYPDALYARRAIQAGASGYVGKEHATEVVISAIQHVLAGGIYLSHEVTESLLREATGRERGPLPDPVSTLSDRELEVFQLTGRGLSTHQIALQMHLSAKTIETYRARSRIKLGVDNGSDVVRLAIHWVLEHG